MRMSGIWGIRTGRQTDRHITWLHQRRDQLFKLTMETQFYNWERMVKKLHVVHARCGTALDTGMRPSILFLCIWLQVCSRIQLKRRKKRAADTLLCTWFIQPQNALYQSHRTTSIAFLIRLHAPHVLVCGTICTRRPFGTWVPNQNWTVRNFTAVPHLRSLLFSLF